MPARCTICYHPERDAIEESLISGASMRDIAGRFELAKSSLSRHMASHLPADVIEESTARDAQRAETLRERLEDLYGRAERILDEAEAAGRPTVALAGVKELRGILEFASKIAGSFTQEPVVIRLSLHDGTPLRSLHALQEGRSDPYGSSTPPAEGQRQGG